MFIKKVSVLFLVLFLFPIAYSANPTPTPPSPSSASSTTDTIQKFLQTMQKDIVEDVNRNMDSNFVELDKSLTGKIKALFSKSVVAVIGGLAIVVFGFAFIQNRIQKHYEMNFYEKMMDAKIQKLTASMPFVVSPTTFYPSVTMSQFDERHVTPAKYFEKLSDSVAFKDYERHIAELKSENERLKSQVSALPSAKRKKVLYESLASDESKPKKFGLDMVALANTIKIMLISIAVIALIVFVIYLFMSGNVHFPFSSNISSNNSMVK